MNFSKYQAVPLPNEERGGVASSHPLCSLDHDEILQKRPGNLDESTRFLGAISVFQTSTPIFQTWWPFFQTSTSKSQTEISQRNEKPEV